MCGIAGYWSPGHAADPVVLERMIHALAHRGPDSHGIWIAPNRELGLAHARLAIVDLSPAGHQPMASADGRYHVTYNGEIYNYMELRRALDARGCTPEHGWRGHCDTEVLLAAVDAWGLDKALERFVGMFAFALWDNKEQRLTLTRDRLGIKPLYCGYRQGRLLFASELKALMQHPSWHGEVSTEALDRYLRLSYVPAPLSMFKGVYKLLPGSHVTFSPRDLERGAWPRATRYWSVERAVLHGLENPLSAPLDALADELEDRLKEAVRLRLVADVPLGAFLSGGVDSSTVVALMQQTGGGVVRTFSIGSRSSDYNEADMARAVAGHLGTRHTELIVEPTEALEAIRLMPGLYDEPHADASQVPTYLVSRLARREVKVCLSGDGGDELFGGYNRYFFGPALWKRARLAPRPLRALLAPLLRGAGEAALTGVYAGLGALRPGRKQVPLFRDKLQKVVEALPAASREEFFQAVISTWQRREVLLQEPVGERDPVCRSLAPEEALPEDLDFASWMMARDQNAYLPDDILTKTDRATMAVALEGRVPILDHRVVELAWRMPLSAKLEGGKGKSVLRRVLYRHVPPELVERPKQGFDLPLDAWLRGPLKDWAASLLRPESLERGGLRPDIVLGAWREHQSRTRNMQWRLWAVLMYQAWRATYL